MPAELMVARIDVLLDDGTTSSFEDLRDVQAMIQAILDQKQEPESISSRRILAMILVQNWPGAAQALELGDIKDQAVKDLQAQKKSQRKMGRAAISKCWSVSQEVCYQVGDAAKDATGRMRATSKRAETAANTAQATADEAIVRIQAVEVALEAEAEVSPKKRASSGHDREHDPASPQKKQRVSVQLRASVQRYHPENAIGVEKRYGKDGSGPYTHKEVHDWCKKNEGYSAEEFWASLCTDPNSVPADDEADERDDSDDERDDSDDERDDSDDDRQKEYSRLSPSRDWQ